MELSTYIAADREGQYFKLKASLLRVLGLIFLLAVTSRVFLATLLYPVEFVLEILLEVSLVLYVFYRIVTRVIEKNYRFLSIEVYLGILFVFPIIPAIAAWLEFGQPVFYGVATYRDFYLLFGALVVFNLLREGAVTIKEVEHAFVSLAVFYMLFSYFLTVFVDPAQFKDTAFSGSNPEKGGEVYYRLNLSMFFFGAVYFTVKSFYRKKLLYLIVASVFIYYVVFIRLDRTSMAVLGLSLILFFLTATSARTKILTVLRALIPLTVLSLVVVYFLPDVYSQYATMFMDVIDTAGKANTGSIEDNIRLMEVDIAIHGILKNPIIGNGKVSQYFVADGYNHFFGFFYTSDVGIFGYLFSSGIVGLVIIFSQFAFAIKCIWSIKRIKRNVFLVALKFTLLAHALDGLTTEYLTMYAGQTITMIIIIYYFYLCDKAVDLKMGNTITSHGHHGLKAIATNVR